MKFFHIIRLSVFRIEKNHGECQCLICFIQCHATTRWIGTDIEYIEMWIFLQTNFSLLEGNEDFNGEKNSSYFHRIQDFRMFTLLFPFLNLLFPFIAFFFFLSREKFPFLEILILTCNFAARLRISINLGLLSSNI